jgi:hypothetical protein
VRIAGIPADDGSGFHFTAWNAEQVPVFATFNTRASLPDYVLIRRTSKANDGIDLLTCSIPAPFDEQPICPSLEEMRSHRNAIHRKKEFSHA